jgi:hypothetical protein
LRKVPITPSSSLSPIAVNRCRAEPGRTSCTDYSIVTHKTKSCKKISPETLRRTGCTDYSIVTHKTKYYKEISPGTMSRMVVPITPSSHVSSNTVRGYDGSIGTVPKFRKSVGRQLGTCPPLPRGGERTGPHRFGFSREAISQGPCRALCEYRSGVLRRIRCSLSPLRDGKPTPWHGSHQQCPLL